MWWVETCHAHFLQRHCTRTPNSHEQVGLHGRGEEACRWVKAPTPWPWNRWFSVPPAQSQGSFQVEGGAGKSARGRGHWGVRKDSQKEVRKAGGEDGGRNHGSRSVGAPGAGKSRDRLSPEVPRKALSPASALILAPWDPCRAVSCRSVRWWICVVCKSLGLWSCVTATTDRDRLRRTHFWSSLFWEYISVCFGHLSLGGTLLVCREFQ